MTKTYCTNGKPLDIVKRVAKALKTDQGISLTDAKDMLARIYKHKDWQNLVESSVKVEDDFEENFCFKRMHGRDEVVFDAWIIQDLIGDGQYASEDLPVLHYTRTMTVGDDPDTVISYVELVNLEDPDQALDSTPTEFTPKVKHSVDDYMVGLAEAIHSGPSMLIGIFQDAGFFDIDPFAEITNGEHEALLTLEMRKVGRKVGERVSFNTDHSPRYKCDMDWDRRCFPNLLDDHSVLVSNGSNAAAELEFKVVPAAEYRDLVIDMVAELGDEAYTTQAGEIWMYDRVLAPAKTPDLSM